MTTEPMTVERFGEECIRASLTNMPAESKATLHLQTKRDPKNDTRNALAYRCVLSCHGRAFETPFTTGKGNVDRWIKAHLTEARHAAARGQWTCLISSKDAALLFDPECPSYRRSIDGALKLAALHETYRPDLGSVLWSVFRDADGIEEHEDWVSWADDLGYFVESPGQTRCDRLAHIRSAMASFEACRRAHFFLRSVFGRSSYNYLMGLSREV